MPPNSSSGAKAISQESASDICDACGEECDSTGPDRRHKSDVFKTVQSAAQPIPSMSTLMTMETLRFGLNRNRTTIDSAQKAAT